MTDSSTQVLTNSRMRTWRECARKEHLSYNMRVKPKKIGDALRFGSLVHAGLESWWKGEGLVGALAAVQVEADPFERVKAMALIEGYDVMWSGEEIEALEVEVEFEAPLLNPKTWAASRTWRLAGKIDAIVKMNGQTMVREFKTTSEAIENDGDDYWLRLAIDSQVSQYIIGAEALGYQVSSTLYDVARKPLLRPDMATPPDVRKYTKDGRLYANQRDRDETPNEYYARVKTDVLSNLNYYFKRKIIPRSEEQLKDHMADVWMTARSIRDAQLLERHPRSPESCMRYGRCPYWSCCINGEDPLTSPDFEVLPGPNPELTHAV